MMPEKGTAPGAGGSRHWTNERRKYSSAPLRYALDCADVGAKSGLQVPLKGWKP
jgi:hypothetical protein